jgi:hypothetical protein
LGRYARDPRFGALTFLLPKRIHPKIFRSDNEA